MAKVILSFKFKDGRFSLCPSVKGTSIRHYKEVQGLSQPNYDKWDNKNQVFIGLSEEVMRDNCILLEMIKRYQSL
jgi:hypothetical protein